MTQPKLRQLKKLLTEWADEFEPNPNRAYGDQDNSQPCYVELLRDIARQVGREID